MHIVSAIYNYCSFCFQPDNRFFVSGSYSGHLSAWSLESFFANSGHVFDAELRLCLDNNENVYAFNNDIEDDDRFRQFQHRQLFRDQIHTAPVSIVRICPFNDNDTLIAMPGKTESFPVPRRCLVACGAMDGCVSVVDSATWIPVMTARQVHQGIYC